MSAKRFPDRDVIAAVRAATEELEAGGQHDEVRRIAGRVLARREMGKLVFLDLVDRSGRIQLLCDTGRTGEVDVHLGDVVGVAGRPAKSRRGEPSLAVDELTVLARNRSPLPDTFHGLTDVETRYRKRYLDLLMSEDSRALFLLRAKVVSAIRRYLDDEGFVEVETPVLQPRYGGAFAHPFVTHSQELDADLYLRIATELYLKRLIVGGLERVYEIGKDFRNESISYKHQPEFTMLEWYEAYADFRDTMDRIETMLERVVDTEADKDWPQLVDHAFSHFVEPSLVEPTIVYGHPVELSPFARVADEDESLTERFEYFAAGMELGNAYSEINDPGEQQRRFDEQPEHVEGVRGDPDYVEALSYGMPPTGGLGLGIDRLVMLLSGRETIRDVILFPALRAGDR
jgi:lysyl-tRNA synthetase, class II